MTKRDGSSRNFSPIVFSYPSVASYETVTHLTSRLHNTDNSNWLTKNCVDRPEFFSIVTRISPFSATSFIVNKMGTSFGMDNIDVKTPRYPLIRTTIARSQIPVNNLKEVRSLVCEPELPYLYNNKNNNNNGEKRDKYNVSFTLVRYYPKHVF